MGDTSLFLTVTDIAFLNSHLKDDLSKINDWTYSWKMGFYPNITKHAHEFFLIERKCFLPLD